jgi:hypothetical protein
MLGDRLDEPSRVDHYSGELLLMKKWHGRLARERFSSFEAGDNTWVMPVAFYEAGPA